MMDLDIETKETENEAEALFLAVPNKEQKPRCLFCRYNNGSGKCSMECLPLDTCG